MPEPRVIKIEPVTRLEGHAKISIFLDKNGDVDDAYFQVVELRGFEKFCEGRLVEEMPIITTRICGVCPWNHHLASAKATDAVYKVDIPPAAKKIRELGYHAFFIHDHSTHFYALGGPDFIVGPESPQNERNIAGVLNKVGTEVGSTVLKALRYAHEAEEIIGGRSIHPVFAVPGGVGRPLTDTERARIEEIGEFLLDYTKFTVKTFEETVIKNKKYLDMITGDTYKQRTFYMGMTDKNKKVSYYDGDIRVIRPNGEEFANFKPSDYLDHIAEAVEPWSYVKFPYLKKIGWKGLVEGDNSGIYRVGPLARFNVAEGLATPLAQEAYRKMYETLEKPAHETLAYHWARVIEMLYSSERLLELARDPETMDKNVRTIPTQKPEEGIGVVEAPRGTLIHHYKTDPEGRLTKANFIVATTHNNPSICISVRKAAQRMIKKGKVDDGILNKVEMAFRAYDPCFACATHTLPGHMPMEIEILDSNGRPFKTVSRM